MHFTLKENPLKRSDLDDFVGCYFGKVDRDALPRVLEEEAAQQRRPTSRHNRIENEQFKSFTYDDLMKPDQGEPRHLLAERRSPGRKRQTPGPEAIAANIAADLEAALEQFAAIAEDLKN